MFLLHNYIPCKHWLSILLDKKNSLPNMSREIKGPLRTGQDILTTLILTVS